MECGIECDVVRISLAIQVMYMYFTIDDAWGIAYRTKTTDYLFWCSLDAKPYSKVCHYPKPKMA